ncbi:hypothetical protein ACJBCE_00150 [Streptomyces sp. NBUL23]|uniref:hypothetical protein n=1 Tax=Streptomyces sp. NBUL23 TaxID=3381354 RepID=UPI00387206FF
MLHSSSEAVAGYLAAGGTYHSAIFLREVVEIASHSAIGEQRIVPLRVSVRGERSESLLR